MLSERWCNIVGIDLSNIVEGGRASRRTASRVDYAAAAKPKYREISESEEEEVSTASIMALESIL